MLFVIGRCLIHSTGVPTQKQPIRVFQLQDLTPVSSPHRCLKDRLMAVKSLLDQAWFCLPHFLRSQVFSFPDLAIIAGRRRRIQVSDTTLTWEHHDRDLGEDWLILVCKDKPSSQPTLFALWSNNSQVRTSAVVAMKTQHSAIPPKVSHCPTDPRAYLQAIKRMSMLFINMWCIATTTSTQLPATLCRCLSIIPLCLSWHRFAGHAMQGQPVRSLLYIPGCLWVRRFERAPATLLGVRSRQ